MGLCVCPRVFVVLGWLSVWCPVCISGSVHVGTKGTQGLWCLSVGHWVLLCVTCVPLPWLCRGACLGAFPFLCGIASGCACRSECLPLTVNLSVSCVCVSGFLPGIGDCVSLFLCGVGLACVLSVYVFLCECGHPGVCRTVRACDSFDPYVRVLCRTRWYVCLGCRVGLCDVCWLLQSSCI